MVRMDVRVRVSCRIRVRVNVSVMISVRVLCSCVCKWNLQELVDDSMSVIIHADIKASLARSTKEGR